MSILQTVAMATNCRKDNHFLLFSTDLIPFLDLALVKYLETRQSCRNDFYRILKNRAILFLIIQTNFKYTNF